MMSCRVGAFELVDTFAFKGAFEFADILVLAVFVFMVSEVGFCCDISAPLRNSKFVVYKRC